MSLTQFASYILMDCCKAKLCSHIKLFLLDGLFWINYNLLQHIHKLLLQHIYFAKSINIVSKRCMTNELQHFSGLIVEQNNSTCNLINIIRPESYIVSRTSLSVCPVIEFFAAPSSRKHKRLFDKV